MAKKEPKPKAASTIAREDFLRIMEKHGFNLRYIGNSWGSSDFLIDGEPLELAKVLSRTGLRHIKLLNQDEHTCILRVLIYDDVKRMFNDNHYTFRIEVFNGWI